MSWLAGSSGLDPRCYTQCQSHSRVSVSLSVSVGVSVVDVIVSASGSVIDTVRLCRCRGLRLCGACVNMCVSARACDTVSVSVCVNIGTSVCIHVSVS